MKTITVTQLEKAVLESLASNMYAERGFSDAGYYELRSDTGLTNNVLRGVVSSLIKKDLVSVWDRKNEIGINHRDVDMHIIYLTDLTEGLVNSWVEEDEIEAVKLITA